MRYGAAAGLVAGVLALAGCAHIEPPPGGPEDTTPPQLVVTRPDSLTVLTDLRAAVVLGFHERISERGLDDVVLVSPRTSVVRVAHGRDELRVSLRDGWEPGRIYQITVLPGVQDLFGNLRTEPIHFVFSTGPSIPLTHLEGTVRDRITNQPVPDTRVEAILQPDSLVYAAVTDSVGEYILRRVPEGAYQLRAFQDMNRNRMLDAYEPRDIAAAELMEGDSMRIDFQILVPDTTPPVITGVQAQGQLVEVTFDDYLEPEQSFDPVRVLLETPAGARVRVAEITLGTPPVLEAELAADPAAADVAETMPALPGEPPAAADPGTTPAAETAEAADAETPRPARTLYLRLHPEEPSLDPELEYRVSLYGVMNVNGLVNDVTASFTPSALPEPEPEPTPAEDGVAPGEAPPVSGTQDTSIDRT